MRQKNGATNRERIGITRVLLWVGVCSLAYPASAHAYLDPGTGSLIIQALIGFILAMGVTAKSWWHRSKDLLARALGRNGSSTKDDA